MGTTTPPTRPAEVRRALGFPRYRVARRVGTTDGNVRLYEANPQAVSEHIRARLDAIYTEMYQQLRARVDELGRREPLHLVRSTRVPVFE